MNDDIEVLKPIIDFLIAERKNRKISQRELARRLKVHYNLLYKWEAHLIAPTYANLQCWAKALGLELALVYVDE